MRLIDADELLEHAYRDRLNSRELIIDMINNAPTVKEIPIKVPIDLIIKALEQEPKTGWIPVSERLPKENGRYLVALKYFTHNHTDVVGFSDGLCDADDYAFQNEITGWYDYDSEYGFYEVDNVVAWQPLPEPYKGSEG